MGDGLLCGASPSVRLRPAPSLRRQESLQEPFHAPRPRVVRSQPEWGRTGGQDLAAFSIPDINEHRVFCPAHPIDDAKHRLIGAEALGELRLASVAVLQVAYRIK